MMRQSVLAIIFTLVSSDLYADTIVRYQGIARIKGVVSYIEDHEVVYSPSNKIVSATTFYKDSNGGKIAELHSDFRQSVAVPVHELINYSVNNIQGLRRDGTELTLYNKDGGEKESTKTLDEADSPKMYVAGQGLNYYLLENMERLYKEKILPVRFIVPAKLDYYDFYIKYVEGFEKRIVKVEIAIDNWFLRLFTPKLLVTYDLKRNQILYYNGLSNIYDKNGDPLKVEIEYTSLNVK